VTRPILICAVLLIVVLLITSCGTTISVGAGVDMNHRDAVDDTSGAGKYRSISSDATVGTVRVASPSYHDFTVEYFHASGISAKDYTAVDVASINYTLTLGE
jgi:predicted small secreted protein